MLRKVPRSFLVVWLLMLMFVPATFAYEPGLLVGKTLTGDGYTKNLQNINDNNSTTYTNIYYNFSYTFADPVDLSGYYVYGTSIDLKSRIDFFREDGSLIKRVYINEKGNSKVGVLQSEEVFQVKKVTYVNGDGFFDYIYDFEVYKAVDLTPPGDLRDVSARGISDTQIALSWLPPNDPDFKQVHVYRNGSRIAVLTGSAGTISNLTPDTEYTFILRAVDADFNESVGVTVSARTLEPPPTEPPPPGSVKIELDGAATYTTAALTFRSSKASGIKLYRDGTVIASLPGNATTYKDESLQPGKTYRYWIVAENAIGSTASQIIEVKTPTLPKPSDVNISGKARSDSVVELTFGAKDATSVKVYRDGKEIATLSGAATFYTDHNLKESTTYRYWIVAENEQGTAASEIIEVQTATRAQVKNLRAIEKGPNIIKFAWDKEPTADKYKIEITVTHRLTAALDWSGEAPPTTTTTLESTTNEVDVTNLKPGERVDIAVSLINKTFGVHGTARATEVVPTFEVPDLGGSSGRSGLFTPNDVFSSSVSLASNFWPFLLLALAFVVAPWIYFTFSGAAKKPKAGSTSDPGARTAREQQREIRLALRKGE